MKSRKMFSLRYSIWYQAGLWELIYIDTNNTMIFCPGSDWKNYWALNPRFLIRVGHELHSHSVHLPSLFMSLVNLLIPYHCHSSWGHSYFFTSGSALSLPSLRCPSFPESNSPVLKHPGLFPFLSVLIFVCGSAVLLQLSIHHF